MTPGQRQNKIDRMTITEDMKSALSRVAATQQLFWDALRDFERETGIDVDSTKFDFIDYETPTDDDVRQILSICAEGDYDDDDPDSARSENTDYFEDENDDEQEAQ